MGRRSKMPVCGNGIVEEGENCDCGLNKSCISVEACCNPRTCQFYRGAECLSGVCCSGCKLLPAGYTCRASRNTCDVPESCDGTSPQCPDDDTLLDGSVCPQNDGTCFHGQCVGAEQQCVDLWGAGARVAHDSCYTSFNPTGSMTGHCGYDSRLYKYIPCFEHDAKCGLLHCEGGLPYPRVASSNFMIFRVNTRDGSYECKSISSSTHSVLVSDGTTCGPESFCQNNTCIEQPRKSSCQPEKNCSGNGICTSTGACYCHPQWKGADCSIFDYQYQDTRTFNRSLPFGADSVSPTAFAGVATMTFLLVILCIIVSCLFRSKKSRKPRELTVIGNTHSNHPQVTINPQEFAIDEAKIVSSLNQSNANLISTPASMHRTPLHRSPFMASSRSITSACTGLSYLASDTPRSVRYVARKPSITADIFSDSETSRTRPRRPLRHMGSPYLQANVHRHQQSYATLTLKRPEASIRYEPSRQIYDDIDQLSTNEHLRDFIQVLDSLAQEKFGGTEVNARHSGKQSIMASSPTETNESITLDSGYQSTKQLMNNDEYAVVMKSKAHEEKFAERQRRRSFSSMDHQEDFCKEKNF